MTRADLVALAAFAGIAACAPADPSSPRSLPVGAVPNDVEVVSCEGRAIALVAASGDGAVDAVPLDGRGGGPPRLAFPPAAGVGANPFDVAVSDDGLAAVTLFGTGEVVLFDPCAGAEIARASPADDDGRVEVAVDPPLTLRSPQDADRDGDRETVVERLVPSTPEGALFAGGRLLVAFPSVLEAALSADEPAHLGPGVLVAWDVSGGALRPAGHLVLPCKNPQSASLDGDGGVWASCSGVFAADYSSSDGAGLVRVDPSSMTITRSIPTPGFSPGKAAAVGGVLVVGDVLSARVALLPIEAESFDEAALLDLPGDGLDAVFEIEPWRDGLALAPQMNADVVHVVDVERGLVDPAPYEGGIGVGEAALVEGPIAIAVVPPGSAAPDGADGAVALLGFASRLERLSLDGGSR